MFSFDNFDKRVKEKGMTKIYIAQKLGKHSVIFHDWKKGKSTPSDADLKTTARCLNCTVAYLRGEVGEPNVETLPADPAKVRELKEFLDLVNSQRSEEYWKLVEILKNAAPDGEQPFDSETLDVAERFSRLNYENRARMMDYLALLDGQGNP